jgi:hypothetical protein
MIRTNAVQLTVIPAVAYRQKLTSGGSGITILRPDAKQPGIASISKTSGKAIPAVNTDTALYPEEAFEEAMDLTRGLPYRKQNGIKVTKDMVIQPEEEKEQPEENIMIDTFEYQKILDAYCDKNGKFSYDLLNKDLIRFAKSSSIVRTMVAEQRSAASIRNYVVSNKFKNITGDDELTSKELKAITELLDEIEPKGVFKEFNSEIRKMLSVRKKA